jgi:hypothetical protein
MNTIKSLILTTLFTITHFAYSQVNIPKYYKELKESPANGKKMNRINVDFDKDSINDTAVIVKNEKEVSKYQLLIYLSSQNKTYSLLLSNEDDFSVYPVELKIKNNVIEVGYFKDGTAAFGRFLKFKFNLKLKKIQLIGYDSSYRIENGHCSKSYNLLTGEYTVNIDTENWATHKKSLKSFKGKKTASKFFIEEIDNVAFQNLDEVGSEFETN